MLVLAVTKREQVVATHRQKLVLAKQDRKLFVAGGRQGPAGRAGAALLLAVWDHSATTGHGTANRVTANNVTLTLPPAPDDGEIWQFSVEQPYTGFKINGNGAKTDGISGDNPFPVTPCSGTLQFNQSESNWFLTSLYAGQNPA